MAPVIRNEKLMTISDRIGFPDDVSIGFIIGMAKTATYATFILSIDVITCVFCNAEYLLKVPLTVIDEFHSHLEQLDQIPVQTFRKQVCFVLNLLASLSSLLFAKQPIKSNFKLNVLRFVSFIQQISFSYAFENNVWNVVKIDGGFNERIDPTRLLSLHCHLFPHLNSCSRLR